MKCSSKRVNLIGLALLGIFGIVGFINLTNGTQIVPPSAESGHVVRLFSLFLWKGSNDTGSVLMKVNEGENFLEMQGGLAVGSGNTVGDNAGSVVIGGGLNNKVENKNVGILGGISNVVGGVNSLIGGGVGNGVSVQNAVVGGGSGNVVSADNGVVIGGEKNRVEGENGVVLGGQSNKVKGKNSLVGGYGAEGNIGSFAWSAKAKENTARIDVNSGMLIGTVTPINGVRLVVSGAVSLSKFKEKDNMGTTGEIRVVSGCIYAYDGKHWQIMGKASRVSCEGAANVCRFGEQVLYQGDSAKAYSNFYSTGCSNIMTIVTCSGGNLVNNKNQTGVYYPYCYNISYKCRENECLDADLNKDGERDDLDRQIIIDEMKKSKPNMGYDLNCDRKVTAADIQVIRKCSKL